MAGTLTRAELREELNKNLGGRVETTDTGGRTRLHRALDMAQDRIARSHDFIEMFQNDTDAITPVGTPSTDRQYTGMPSTLKDIYSLMHADASDITAENRFLIHVPQRQWRQLLGDSRDLSTGEVSHYSRWNTLIEWFRIPTDPFTLVRRYSIWPTALTIDTQKSDFSHKDDLIISAATEYMFHSLGMRQDAQQWFVIFRDRMERAKREDMYQPDVSLFPRGASEQGGSVPSNYWADPFVREEP